MVFEEKYIGALLVVTGCTIGSAYGIARSGVGIQSTSFMQPGLVMNPQLIRSLVPVFLAFINSLYGFSLAKEILCNDCIDNSIIGGAICGISGLTSGFAIGIVGDAGVRVSAQQSRLYTGQLIILSLCELIAFLGYLLAKHWLYV